MTSDQSSDAITKTAPPDGSIADLYREVLPVLNFEAEQTKWDVALTIDFASESVILEQLAVTYNLGAGTRFWNHPDEGNVVIDWNGEPGDRLAQFFDEERFTSDGDRIDGGRDRRRLRATR